MMTHSEIHLPILKKGDDMNDCLVKNTDGTVNVKESLAKYSDLLLLAVDTINNNIPDTNNLTLCGDTHYIGLSGDAEIIQKLAGLNLVSVYDDYASDPDPDSDSSGSDTDSEDDSDLSEGEIR